MSAVEARRQYRILINGVHAKTGGGVTYLRGLLPLLANDPELELHLFIHQEQLAIFADFDERIRIHAFDFRPTLVFLSLWEQFSLPALARAMAADVLFSPANFGPFLSASSVILLRNSLAVVEREGRLAKRIYWGALAFATAISVLRSSRTIAVSKYAVAALTRRLPASVHKKIFVVYHGIRESFFARSPAKERESFLLIVADIYIQKNLHTMMEALSKIYGQIPGIRLKIAGRIVDQDYFNEIRGLTERLKLQDCVEFLGPVDIESLVSLYRRCRLLVFPSTVETFGHPLIEAMACGTPIASSNTAAMPEVLGDAGIYFDPLDPEDMANKVLELYNNATLRKELTERGYQRAQRFALPQTVAETARVLKLAARPTPLTAI
jgi:glycosyltransferase involved in cell wall biosynthesis